MSRPWGLLSRVSKEVFHHAAEINPKRTPSEEIRIRYEHFPLKHSGQRVNGSCPFPWNAEGGAKAGVIPVFGLNGKGFERAAHRLLFGEQNAGQRPDLVDAASLPAQEWARLSQLDGD